jgi:glycosyltransferase involved in cell wall biosynthesis
MVAAGDAPYPYHPKRTQAQPRTQIKQNLYIQRCKSWMLNKHPGVNFLLLNNFFRFKPRVVYIHGVTSLNVLYGVYYKFFCDSKVFLDCHNDIPNQSPSSKLFKGRIFLKVFSIFINFLLKVKIVTAVLPIGLGSTTYCQKILNINQKYLKQIKLGYDSDTFFENQILRKNFRYEHRISDDAVAIGIIGKMTTEKRLDLALNFYEIIQTKISKLVVVLVYETQEDAIKVEIQNFKNRSRKLIELPLLNENDRAAFYNAMDICIWPGRPSISIQECIGCGCPVITSDHPSTSDFWVSQYFFKNVDNGKSLLSSIQNCGDIRKLFCELKNSQSAMIKNYTWRKIAKELTIELL